MALNPLATISTIAGYQGQNEATVAKRLRNAQTIQEVLRSKAAMGEKVSPKDAMSLAATLTGGNSLLYGYDNDLVTNSMLEAQNRNAQAVQLQQATGMMEQEQRQRDYLKNLFDFNQDFESDVDLVDDLSKRFPEYQPLIEKNRSLLPNLYQSAVQEQADKMIGNPLFRAQVTEDNLDTDFGNIPKSVRKALSSNVPFIESERNKAQVGSFISKAMADNKIYTMDDQTFKDYIDPIIRTHAREVGITNLTPKLYQDLKDSLYGLRSDYQRKLSDGKNDAAWRIRLNIFSDPSMKALISQGQFDEALRFAKSLATGTPAELVTDPLILTMASWLPDGCRHWLVGPAGQIVADTAMELTAGNIDAAGAAEAIEATAATLDYGS